MKISFVLFSVVFVSLGLFFISASGTKVQDIKYSHVKVQKCDVDGNIAWEHMKAALVPGFEAMTNIPGDGILKTADLPAGRKPDRCITFLLFCRFLKSLFKATKKLEIIPLF